MSRSSLSVLVSVFVLFFLIGSTNAQIENRPFAVFDSGSPPDAFGLDGFDINSEQSVAVRFYNNVDGLFNSLQLWFMSNYGLGQNNHNADDAPNDDDYPTVDINIVKGNNTAPTYTPNSNLATNADNVIESFLLVSIPVSGWNPLLITLNSTARPELISNEYYWIVIESKAQPMIDPLWSISNTNSYSTTTQNGVWQTGAFSMSVAATVIADNPSGGPSVKNVMNTNSNRPCRGTAKCSKSRK